MPRQLDGMESQIHEKTTGDTRKLSRLVVRSMTDCPILPASRLARFEEAFENGKDQVMIVQYNGKQPAILVLRWRPDPQGGPGYVQKDVMLMPGNKIDLSAFDFQFISMEPIKCRGCGNEYAIPKSCENCGVQL